MLKKASFFMGGFLINTVLNLQKKYIPNTVAKHYIIFILRIQLYIIFHSV